VKPEVRLIQTCSVLVLHVPQTLPLSLLKVLTGKRLNYWLNHQTPVESSHSFHQLKPASLFPIYIHPYLSKSKSNPDTQSLAFCFTYILGQSRNLCLLIPILGH